MNMARDENATGSVTITITVSTESDQLLRQLAKRGIYGRGRATVAAGFVDRRLQDLVESGALKPEEDTKKKR